MDCGALNEQTHFSFDYDYLLFCFLWSDGRHAIWWRDNSGSEGKHRACAPHRNRADTGAQPCRHHPQG
ncbi:hypothetical protein AA0616_1956 [Komagataeibacter nataicola NRIC 0616]|nr:hypothetical protein AA0616_1956 [Komagataeibacter nataicola NRIC 0616]